MKVVTEGGVLMKAITLFSSAGIDEAYLSAIGIDVIAANELLVKRAKIHEWLYPNCKMIMREECTHFLWQRKRKRNHWILKI